ncbi:Predicted dehydrogenase [Pseudobutyrivibrio sp. NOR37]|uniref:Gfo/Idh/MocA family oxidoreductase n=1 Tax=Pseudobutyrivibrio xylanivorans TaxID=185007 RepID=A0A6M0LJQ7_PSEXY|nr:MULTISPECIES: Gfo/Idh/MocA family oxidoreductase [Pseudobutyrivibrio]NEX01141.1 Gfo/Idh/MocA family oxidoreductase [Pseudobutyrivibrio xylanivorans]SFR65306.1 Predicted dehydrogenase [Pseudobutyrivibrio sp. NOR37]
MEKVKWGVLGTANIAKVCTIPGMQQVDTCELYAIAGRDINKALKFKDDFGFQKAYGSYEELIEDSEVQAIYIPLPNGLHLKWVKEALQHKKHVICEKPLALNASAARDMFETAKANGVVLMEAYAYLHSPYIKSLKADIDSGLIGEIDYIESEFLTQGYSEDIRLYKDQGGGAMYDLGCYCTTMILSLIDSTPTSVIANARYTELGVDELTNAIIKLKNGVNATFTVGMILGKDSGSRFDKLYIHGSKGAIRSDVEFNQSGELSYKIYLDKEIIDRKISVPQNYSLEIASA